MYSRCPLSPRQKTSNNVRLGMINNPSAAPSAETSRVARAIFAAMQTQSANNAKNFITKMAKEETAAALEKGVDIGEFAVGVSGRRTASLISAQALIHNCPDSFLFFINCLHVFLFFFLQGMDVSLFKEAYENPKVDFLLSHTAYCRDVLKLKKGQKAVISNGRVSHPLVSYCVKSWTDTPPTVWISE